MGETFIPLLRKISGSSSEGVRFSASFSRAVHDTKVETGEVFGPTGLAAVQELREHEVFEVLVVREDLDDVRGTFEFGAPFLEASNNG